MPSTKKNKKKKKSNKIKTATPHTTETPTKTFSSPTCTNCEDCGCCKDVTCYHGLSDELGSMMSNGNDPYWEVLVEYQNMISIFVMPQCTPDQRSMMEIDYIQKNFRIVVNPDFAAYLFSLCTFLFFKLEGMSWEKEYEARVDIIHILQLGLKIRYDMLQQVEGNSDRGPGSPIFDKMVKYRRDVHTERGIIKCLAREIPCDCMKEPSREAKTMEKLSLCHGCSKEFPKRQMYYCVCKYVTYCGKECQRAHWPVHKSKCPGKVQNTNNDVVA